MSASSNNAKASPDDVNPYAGNFPKPCYNCLLQGQWCYRRRLFCFNNPREKLVAFPDLKSLQNMRDLRLHKDVKQRVMFPELRGELEITPVLGLDKDALPKSVPMAVSTRPKPGPNDVNLYARNFPDPCHNCKLQGEGCHDLRWFCFNNPSEVLIGFPDVDTLDAVRELRNIALLNNLGPIGLPVVSEVGVMPMPGTAEDYMPASLPLAINIVNPCAECELLEKPECDISGKCKTASLLPSQQSSSRPQLQQQYAPVFPVPAEQPATQNEPSGEPSLKLEGTLEQKNRAALMLGMQVPWMEPDYTKAWPYVYPNPCRHCGWQSLASCDQGPYCFNAPNTNQDDIPREKLLELVQRQKQLTGEWDTAVPLPNFYRLPTSPQQICPVGLGPLGFSGTDSATALPPGGRPYPETISEYNQNTEASQFMPSQSNRGYVAHTSQQWLDRELTDEPRGVVMQDFGSSSGSKGKAPVHSGQGQNQGSAARPSLGSRTTSAQSAGSSSSRKRKSIQ